MNAKEYIAKLLLRYSAKEVEQQKLIHRYRIISNTSDLKAAQARLQAYTQARLDIESILDKMD